MEGERRSYEDGIASYFDMMRDMDEKPKGPPIQGARENCAYRQVYNHLIKKPSLIPGRFRNSRIADALPRQFNNMAEGKLFICSFDYQ